MLAAGIVFGVMSFITMMISYREMPLSVQRFFYNRPLATDIAVSGFTLLLITGVSSSLIGAVAAMTCGFLVNVVHLVARSGGVKNAARFLVSTIADWVGGREETAVLDAQPTPPPAPPRIPLKDRAWALGFRFGLAFGRVAAWLTWKALSWIPRPSVR